MFEGKISTIAGVATLEGVQLVSTGGPAPAGLAWTPGALYGIVQNALMLIAPVD